MIAAASAGERRKITTNARMRNAELRRGRS